MTFEELLFPKGQHDKAAIDRFRNLCQEVFKSEAGRDLLHLLCKAQHPMMHSPNMTPHEHGRAEVIATLWRFGAINPTPPQ